jgi:type II secretory pathway pseudopilin PulG
MKSTPVFNGRKKAGRVYGAFTLVELIVIIAIMGMLTVFLLPMMANTKTKGHRITCASRLKNIGLAFRVFATDNADCFPMKVNASEGGTADATALDNPTRVFRHFLVLSNEISAPTMCVCPSDKRTIASVFSTNAPSSQGWTTLEPFAGPRNVSYFVGLNADETKPQSLLSGDRNLMIYPAEGVVNPHTNIAISTATQFHTNTATFAWSAREMHRSQGNIALGDGSVQQYTTARLKEAINQAGEQPITLMFPGDER